MSLALRRYCTCGAHTDFERELTAGAPMASQRFSRAMDKRPSLVTLGCLLVPIVFGAGEAAASSHVATAGMELIAVAPDGRGFVERDSGRAFIPFGTNYYDPNTGWAPKMWSRFDAGKVRRHFGVMKELGVN